MATYMHTHTHAHTAHTCPQKQNSRARVRAPACSAQAAWQTLALLLDHCSLLCRGPVHPARAFCMVFPRKLLRARAFARDSAQPAAPAAAAAAARTDGGGADGRRRGGPRAGAAERMGGTVFPTEEFWREGPSPAAENGGTIIVGSALAVFIVAVGSALAVFIVARMIAIRMS